MGGCVVNRRYSVYPSFDYRTEDHCPSAQDGDTLLAAALSRATSVRRVAQSKGGWSVNGR